MQITWAVVERLQQRAPGLSWNPVRVAHVVQDHPDIDHLRVAGAFADWLTYQSSGRTRDGIPALRTFMEKATERLQQQEESSSPSRLRAYDRFIN